MSKNTTLITLKLCLYSPCVSHISAYIHTPNLFFPIDHNGKYISIFFKLNGQKESREWISTKKWYGHNSETLDNDCRKGICLEILVV